MPIGQEFFQNKGIPDGQIVIAIKLINMLEEVGFMDNDSNIDIHYNPITIVLKLKNEYMIDIDNQYIYVIHPVSNTRDNHKSNCKRKYTLKYSVRIVYDDSLDYSQIIDHCIDSN